MAILEVLIAQTFTYEVPYHSYCVFVFKDCFEMLMENTVLTPQTEMSAFFPLASPTNNDTLKDNADSLPPDASLRSISSQISTENCAS